MYMYIAMYVQHVITLSCLWSYFGSHKILYDFTCMYWYPYKIVCTSVFILDIAVWCFDDPYSKPRLVHRLILLMRTKSW